MFVKFIAADTAQDFEEAINDKIGEAEEANRKYKDIKMMSSEAGFYCLIIFE